MRPLGTSNALKGFFINNPFTFIDNDKLYGAVFVARGEQYSKKEFEQFQKLYFLKGFSELRVFLFNDKEGYNFELIRKITTSEKWFLTLKR